jgi:hypothetical protein
MVTHLEAAPNRAEFNLPAQLRDMRVLGATEGYLPTYVIETAAHGLLVYTNLTEQHDTYLASICQQAAIAHRIEVIDAPDPRAVWAQRLSKNGPGLLRLRPGTTHSFQLVLPASAYGDHPKQPLSRLGSYWFDKNLFAQLWCDDLKLRMRGVRERGIRIATIPQVESQADLLDRVGHIAQALQVTPPTFAELRSYADSIGDTRHVAHLDALTP